MHFGAVPAAFSAIAPALRHGFWSPLGPLLRHSPAHVRAQVHQYRLIHQPPVQRCKTETVTKRGQQGMYTQVIMHAIALDSDEDSTPCPVPPTLNKIQP